MWIQLALGGAASRGLWPPDPPTAGCVQVELLGSAATVAMRARRLEGVGQVEGVAFQTLSDGSVQFWRRTKREELCDSGRTQESSQGQLVVQLRQAWVCRVHLKDSRQVIQIPGSARCHSSGVNPVASLSFDRSCRSGAGSPKCGG